jgi:tRNA modification GTPase
VIEAGSRDALEEALATLAGGLSQPLRRLRSDLLDLLADLEAGLDFADEDIAFATPDELLRRLGNALAVLSHLERQLAGRALVGRPFRVALAGRPNAGKTSLFNALTGADALVGAAPGTTRDYLVRRIDLDGVTVELIDTAGWQESVDGIEQQAQALGREQLDEADLVLHCIDAAEPSAAPPPDARTVVIATRCDLAAAPGGRLATSAATGAGLGALRRLLAERARARAEAAPAPSVSRCRHHVAACTEGLRRAHRMVLFGEPPELVALELRTALDHLGEMAGTVYTDDLLDRIFSRFCIGK